MRAVGKYVNAPDERKRYTIDYNEWLDVGETIVSITFEVTPVSTTPFIIDGVAINTGARGASFYGSGGQDGETYAAVATVVTSGGQTKNDRVNFSVKAPA